MLRYKEDLRQVIFVVIATSCMLFVYLYNDAFETSTLIAISLCLFFVYILTLSIAHNHYHRTIFKNDKLNCVMNYMLFLTCGTSPYSWTLQHNIGHHLNYLEQINDPAPWRVNDKIVTRFKYTLFGTFNIYPYCFKIGKRYPKVFKKFKFHLFVSFFILFTLTLIDPCGALFAIIIPTTLSMFNLIDITYEHHTDLDRSCEFKASRTNVNRIRNWFTFNVGYHTEHHTMPGLHWSKLPKHHENIKHLIPKENITNSLS